MMEGKGWSESKMGSYYWMDMEFQFCKTRKFQRWVVVMVVHWRECPRYHCTLKIVQKVNFKLRVFHYNFLEYTNRSLTINLEKLKGKKRGKYYLFKSCVVKEVECLKDHPPKYLTHRHCLLMGFLEEWVRLPPECRNPTEPTANLS